MIASSTHSSTCQIDHSPVRARAHSVAAYTSMHVNMHSYACKRPGSDTETPAPVRLHARVIPAHAHISAPGMRTRVHAHTCVNTPSPALVPSSRSISKCCGCESNSGGSSSPWPRVGALAMVSCAVGACEGLWVHLDADRAHREREGEGGGRGGREGKEGETEGGGEEGRGSDRRTSARTHRYTCIPADSRVGAWAAEQ